MAEAEDEEPTELRLADATAALAAEERSARWMEVGVGRFGSDDVGAGVARPAAAAAERAAGPARGFAMVGCTGMLGSGTWGLDWVRLEPGSDGIYG